MGCSNPIENLKDQVMHIKLMRIAIQMEREKNLKILSKIEGRNIDNDNLPEYLASRNVRLFHDIEMKYGNNLSPNDDIKTNNIFNQNGSRPLIINSKIIKKKKIKKKKRKKRSQSVNNNNENIN